uniref:Transducin-related family protein n=1 Tax=Rhizophora mucronata TaxID=61149 RepID=A0A2P2LV98_RHIMU
MSAHLSQEQCITEHSHRHMQLQHKDCQQLIVHVHQNRNHPHSHWIHCHCCCHHHHELFYLSNHFQDAGTWALHESVDYWKVL